jgi:hypothetical protein
MKLAVWHMFHVDGTNNEDVTEKVVVDPDTTAETTAEIAITIRNALALTAHCILILPKTVAFSNDSTAKKRSYALSVANPVIYSPNAEHGKTSSKLQTGTRDETISSAQRRRQWHSAQWQLHL